MIEVQGIRKQFAHQKILSKVSFSVEKGKSYVILGQSGAGKSVLLKIMAGLIVPDSGHVHIRTKNIGMLFQNNALFDSFTVFENLAFPLKTRLRVTGLEAKKKIEKFLEWVGLPNTEKQMPNELSGGMQKRLGIARALIVEPEVMFYDEPTAGLDPITSRIIADLILRLKNEMKTTVLNVTSDVMRAMQLGDVIGLLLPSSDGATVLHAGPPADAKKSAHPAIKQFLFGEQKGPLTEELLHPHYHEPNTLDQIYAEIDHDPF